MSRLVVLLYHRVAPDATGDLAHLTVSPDRFAWQMTKLRERGFAAQSQAEVAAWTQGRRALPKRAIVVTFDDGYADNAVHAFPVLERYRIPAVTFIVTRKLGGRNDWDGDAAPWPLMDATAIREWAGRGHEFGAHGRTHASLTGLADDALRDEIEGSLADLGATLGQAPIAFAYPYGHVDARARELTARRFALAYGIEEGANRSGADTYALRRTSVLPAYPPYEFLCQLRLGWGPRNCAHRAVRQIWRRPEISGHRGDA